MEILKSLDSSRVVSSYKIGIFKNFEFGFYIKIFATLIDSTELFIREYSDLKERNYSYHWQTKEGELICRWDNAPHYKSLKTYPHHKHQEDKVSENYSIELSDILEIIAKEIANR